MSSQSFKNVAIAGASGNAGKPILEALLSSGAFSVSVLARKESKATFPAGVTVKYVDYTSHSDLVNAFTGQDVALCALNDQAAEFQPGIIHAAFEAGVKRFMPNEWSSHYFTVPGVAPMEEAQIARSEVIDLLKEKVKLAETTGKEFHWTGVNCGIFFDWALRESFLDIKLPPGRSAKVWGSGAEVVSGTNLPTVGQSVVAILTHAESQTRDRIVNIESFPVSQNSIIEALEKATGEKWNIEKTNKEEQLAIAAENLEKGGDFWESFAIWARAFLLTGPKGAKLDNIENELLQLPKESLDGTIKSVLAEIAS